ncbi:MAG: hypothetical protein IJ526_09230 [Lachnospiraceae bacterium]|nr:hypothetical protein [Lachnospiraceae bacterium]
MAAKLLKNNNLSIQQARYDLHIVTKITTIKKYSRIIWNWYDDLFSKGYR